MRYEKLKRIRESILHIRICISYWIDNFIFNCNKLNKWGKKLLPCPFCGIVPRIVVCDDEGDIHEEDGYKKQDGTDVHEKTQWHNVVAWRGLADIAEKYIHKGDKVIVLGMRERVDHFTGEIVKDDYHTSSMSTKELSDFMDRMKIWAQTEFGCYLPYWKDPGYEEMMEQYNNK